MNLYDTQYMSTNMFKHITSSTDYIKMYKL
jgi:hypothetical protein